MRVRGGEERHAVRTVDVVGEDVVPELFLDDASHRKLREHPRDAARAVALDLPTRELIGDGPRDDRVVRAVRASAVPRLRHAGDNAADLRVVLGVSDVERGRAVDVALEAEDVDRRRDGDFGRLDLRDERGVGGFEGCGPVQNVTHDSAPQVPAATIAGMGRTSIRALVALTRPATNPT